MSSGSIQMRVAMRVGVGVAALLSACTLDARHKNDCNQRCDCVVDISERVQALRTAGGSGGKVATAAAATSARPTTVLPRACAPPPRSTSVRPPKPAPAVRRPSGGGPVWQEELMKSVLVPYQSRSGGKVFAGLLKAIRAGAEAWGRASAEFVRFQECSCLQGRYISVVPGDGDGVTNPLSKREQVLPMPVVGNGDRMSPHRIAHQWGTSSAWRIRTSARIEIVTCGSIQRSGVHAVPACRPAARPARRGRRPSLHHDRHVRRVRRDIEDERVPRRWPVRRGGARRGFQRADDRRRLRRGGAVLRGDDGLVAVPAHRAIGVADPAARLPAGAGRRSGRLACDRGGGRIDLLLLCQPRDFVRGNNDNVYTTTRVRYLIHGGMDEWTQVVRQRGRRSCRGVRNDFDSGDAVSRRPIQEDGNIRLRVRRAGTWGGWKSLGAPPAGAASAPALASGSPFSATLSCAGATGSSIGWRARMRARTATAARGSRTPGARSRRRLRHFRGQAVCGLVISKPGSRSPRSATIASPCTTFAPRAAVRGVPLKTSMTTSNSRRSGSRPRYHADLGSRRVGLLRPQPTAPPGQPDYGSGLLFYWRRARFASRRRRHLPWRRPDGRRRHHQ